MSTTQLIEIMNAFVDGPANSKITLKQFVEKYEKAMKKEWQADVRCFSQRMPCCTSFAMEKQVDEVYTIFKFQEFQQELMNKIYCEVFSWGDYNMKLLKTMEKVEKKTFKVIF